jgi:adenosylcobalamin-dependent ribonucleoside-triphosphate reductase
VTDVNFGPTGRLVYERTYSRIKADGSREEWPETVERVVDGNLALVDARHQLPDERQQLIDMMLDFKILPAGRHLWASGVKNAQHLFNCWVAGWTPNPADHFEFTFMRLMEGGGVGANYSNHYLKDYPVVQHFLKVEIVCDEEHIDHQSLKDAGVLSTKYDPDWSGAFQVEDSREGWAAALTDLIESHYRTETQHYQRVYDVSRVRHAGAKLKTFGGHASGPLPLAQMLMTVSQVLSSRAGTQLDGIGAMDIDHAIAQCVVAGGVRRSARMAMMHWADPQIMEFINIKQNSGSHWTTNISVEVDDTFWYQCKQGDAWTASKVLKAISEGMVNNGEPGFWDSSYSNVGEPNPVVCTNPCGEITLEPWEPCNLGHVNLAGFVNDNGRVDGLGLLTAHRLMTRFLIRATFSPVGDPKSREVLDRNRRIGVGHFGVASFLAMTGRKYSKAHKDKSFVKLLREMVLVVDQSAEDFCHDLRIPVPVKKRTIAPTGTIAKMPGVSEGVHPIFAKFFIRRVRLSKIDPDQVAMLKQYEADGFKVEDCQYAANTAVIEIPTKDSLVQEVENRYGRDGEELVEAADDLSLRDLLTFQALYQTHWADNAVSFTANVDPQQYAPSHVEGQIRDFAGKVKGATIFPESSMPQSPYERLERWEYESAVAKQVSDGIDEDCTTGACPVR